jgi:hypothetical protein
MAGLVLLSHRWVDEQGGFAGRVAGQVSDVEVMGNPGHGALGFAPIFSIKKHTHVPKSIPMFVYASVHPTNLR